MASVREWADAYLEQARADLVGASALGGAAPSVLAMLLQMAFEKLAKAALLRTGAVSLQWAQGSHAAASRMVATMRRQRELFALVGGAQVWEPVLSVVARLEKAQPKEASRTGPNTPQLEYPWETLAGAIQWPARDLAVATVLGDPRNHLGAQVLRFASLLAERFDQIFP